MALQHAWPLLDEPVAAMRLGGRHMGCHAYIHRVTNALRRLSVALCKGNAYVLRAGLQSLAGITGRAVVRARARPSAMNE